MYRSRLSLGVAALVAACVGIVEPLAQVVRQLCEAVHGSVRTEAESMPIAAAAPKAKPFTQMKMQACALAMIKRERPKYSPTWRMCPST